MAGKKGEALASFSQQYSKKALLPGPVTIVHNTGFCWSEHGLPARRLLAVNNGNPAIAQHEG
jgi:hypothetical protein